MVRNMVRNVVHNVVHNAQFVHCNRAPFGPFAANSDGMPLA